MNNQEIEENGNRPGRENQDTMEENKRTFQEETEVEEVDKDLRHLSQAQMERVMTKTKGDTE